jgi:hypothetical protein
MDAPELLRAYLAEIQDPAAVAALFAEDGVIELPTINTGVPAPLSSRREFMRAAAASGGAAMLSAGLVPISVDASADKAAQTVLPTATEDVTPFEVHEPQAALDDLKKRLANARWPDKEPVTDWSRGVPLAKAQALVESHRVQAHDGAVVDALHADRGCGPEARLARGRSRRGRCVPAGAQGPRRAAGQVARTDTATAWLASLRQQEEVSAIH